MYNHLSGGSSTNNRRDSLEQDLAERLTRESPRTSSDGERPAGGISFSFSTHLRTFLDLLLCSQLGVTVWFWARPYGECEARAL